MLKLTPRMFAATAFCLSTAVIGGDAFAQFTQTPAPPRQDTPRTEDDELTEDSRAGGALSQESPPADAPQVDDDFVPEEEVVPETVDDDLEDGDIPETTVITGEDPEIAGEVADVSRNRLTLMVRPNPGAPAREVELQVSDTAEVMRNGEPSNLMALSRGDSVRIETAPGDSSVVVRIAATAERRGSVNSIRGNPNVVRDRERRRVRPPVEHEEAVLPLGIEIYAANQAALVTEMLAGGPAENGGVRIGDLIVAVNGDPIRDPELIEQSIAKAGAVELTIQRGDQQLTLSLSPARVVEGALVNPGVIRRNLATYGSIIGPVDGVGVSAPVQGVEAGVPVNGAGVDVEVDPTDAVGPGAVVPNTASEMRRNAQEFEGRQPGTNPRSQYNDGQVPAADPRSRFNEGRTPSANPRSRFQEQSPQGTNPTDQAGQAGQ